MCYMLDLYCRQYGHAFRFDYPLCTLHTFKVMFEQEERVRVVINQLRAWSCVVYYCWTCHGSPLKACDPWRSAGVCHIDGYSHYHAPLVSVCPLLLCTAAFVYCHFTQHLKITLRHNNMHVSSGISISEKRNVLLNKQRNAVSWQRKLLLM